MSLARQYPALVAPHIVTPTALVAMDGHRLHIIATARPAAFKVAAIPSCGKGLQACANLRGDFTITTDWPVSTKEREKYSLTYVEKNGYSIPSILELIISGTQDNTSTANVPIAQDLNNARRQALIGMALSSPIADQEKPLSA